MTRGRKPPDVEAQRDVDESALACLGNALVIRDLVQDRLEAVLREGNPWAVDVAIDDLVKMKKLIRRAQALIKTKGNGHENKDL